MVKTTCLRCKYYRVINETEGVCRVNGKESGNKKSMRPAVTADHSCNQWIDSGQQYYVRLGWIKALARKPAET